MITRPTLLRVLAIFGVTLMISSASVQTAQAVFAEDYNGDNDIFMYDPDATLNCINSNSAPSSGSVTLVGNTNAEKIWNFFVSIGLNPEQAAGIMGNIAQESKYDPNALQTVRNPPKDQGFGIAQWTNERNVAIRAAANKVNKPVNDLGFQLDYLYQEMQSRPAYGKRGAKNEYETIKTLKTINEAVVFFHNSFEVSDDDPADVIKLRGGYAKDAYDAYADLNKVSTGAAVPDAAGGCSNSLPGSGAVTGDLSATTLAYAWPQYKGQGFKQLMPAYGKAVAEKQKNGIYVGGLRNPGVDCGGFTTALIVDSGFDPNFNNGGVLGKGGGATGAQETWMKANWLSLGRGNVINTADLRPGDIAISNGHTFAFVGKIDGFDSQIASASLSTNADGGRAPMAGEESLTGASFTWYRKK